MLKENDLPSELRVIVDLSKVFNDLVPGGTADVFENDDSRLVLLDPLQHTSEGSSRFTIGLDILLLIVQIRVIHTRRSSNQELDSK
jgi:hypothetical protein